MRRILAYWLAAVSLVASAAPVLADSASQPLADRTLVLLLAGDAEALARLHHYPPDYTAEELGADRQAVAKGLRFFLERFGAPRGAHPPAPAQLFYRVGSTGGTNQYWSTVRPARYERYIVEVEFAKLGKGFVQLDLVLFSHSLGFQIKGIDFGLPNSPQSRQIIVSTMHDVLVHMGIPVPANFAETAEQAMQPAGVPPAKLRD